MRTRSCGTIPAGKLKPREQKVIANGNSFSGIGQLANGNSHSIQDPETTERLGDPLMWGWSGMQTVGNAL